MAKQATFSTKENAINHLLNEGFELSDSSSSFATMVKKVNNDRLTANITPCNYNNGTCEWQYKTNTFKSYYNYTGL